jgi:hypothetical protein
MLGRSTYFLLLGASLFVFGTNAAWAQQPFFLSPNDTVSIASGQAVFVDGDVFLNAGSRLFNRGTLRITSSWTGAGGGRYVWDKQPTPSDSLIVLDQYGTAVYTGSDDSIGVFSLNTPTIGTDFSGTATAIRTLDIRGRWVTSNISTLRVGPRGTAVEGTVGVDRVFGPLTIARDATSPSSTRYYPIAYTLSGDPALPVTLYNTLTASANEIRVSAIQGATGALPIAGQRSADLATDLRYEVSLLTGPAQPNVEAESNFSSSGVGSIPITSIFHARRLLRSGVGSAGTYDTLPRVSVSGTVATGTLRSRIPGLSTALTNYLVFGKNKLNAGTLTPVPATINVGDTTRITFAGGDTGADITRSVERSINAGPLTAFASILGTQTGVNSDTIFRPTTFRAIATAGPNFESDTTNTAGPIINPFVTLSLQALLQGAYVAPGTMVGGYTPSFLRTYFTSRSVADSNMYADFGSNVFTVPPGAIDVVSLELRTGTDALTFVPGSRKLAWLMPNGSLRDFRTGSASHPVMYFNVPSGSYYVVIRHRNHLPMMSATPVVFNPVSFNRASYDMTRTANVYAIAPSIQLGGYLFPRDGKITAFLGNVGSRLSEPLEHINAFDFYTVFLKSTLAVNGYLLEDVNLDGFVNALDYQIVQLNNDRLYFSNVDE